jgi:dTDP-4-amino-4,6-dideoxygalactose transaminase
MFKPYAVWVVWTVTSRTLRNSIWPLTHPIIEDGAQHWLSNDSNRLGDCAISFDPTKNLANYGNGGAVITANRDLRDFARDWISNGKYSKHAEIGTNSRMSETDCAQMLVKTRYIDQWQQRRRTIAQHWMEMLKHKPWITCLIDSGNFDEHCFHKFVIHVDNRDIYNAILPCVVLRPKYIMQHPCTSCQHINTIRVQTCSVLAAV